MRDIALRMKPTRDAACAQRATALSRIPEKLPASEVLRHSPAEKRPFGASFPAVFFSGKRGNLNGTEPS